MTHPLPQNWQRKILGDLLSKLEGGGTPSKKNSSYWNGSIPWASVKDVVTHNPDDTQDHISKLGLENSSSRLVSKGTLIVPTRMALGHAVFFNIDVAINQDLKALYPKKDLLNKYLYYWFMSKKKFIEKLGSGSTVSGIQQNELKKIEFLLPPLPEQHRVVSVLETWDKKIEKLKRKIELKKNVKKGLMQQLLTGKKRLPGFSGEWAFKKISEICKTSSGGTPKANEARYYQNGDVPWLKSGEVRRGKISTFKNFITKDGLNDSSAKMFPEETILIAMYGATAGQIGYLQKEASTNQAICGLLPNDHYSSEFLYYVLITKTEELLLLSSGAAQPNISQEIIRDFEVCIPVEKEEQEALAQVLESADQQIQLLQSKLQKLKDQKIYLLNHLITGRIRTPESMSLPS